MITGCNVRDFYLYTFACWAGFVDLWEWVRRWPLEFEAMLHHLGVIVMLWAISEFTIFPVGGEWPWQTSFALSNVGAQWVGDFFMNDIYFATTLAEIKRSRWVQLSMTSVRLINMVMFCSTTVLAIKAESWLAVAISSPLTFGYTYGNLKIIQWTWKFDSKAYYATHQAKWLANEEADTASIAGSEKTACSEKTEDSYSQLQGYGDQRPSRPSPGAESLLRGLAQSQGHADSQADVANKLSTSGKEEAR